MRRCSILAVGWAVAAMSSGGWAAEAVEAVTPVEVAGGEGAAAKGPPVIAGVRPVSVLGRDPLGVMAKGRQRIGFMTIELTGGGERIDRVLRVATAVKPPMAYNFQVRMESQAAVRKGDRLLLRFRARGIRTKSEFGDVMLGPCFERNGDPHTKSLDLRWRLPVGGAWRRIDIPFECVEDYEAGEAMFNFRVGFDPQTVEIAQLTLSNYGREVRLAQLPRSKEPPYRGRDPGAAWRAEAAKRIEANRKGRLTVRVTDPAGKPVAGADVRIAMKRHAFGFGTAISRWLLCGADRGSDGAKYRAAVRELFNKAVIENGHKWGPWESPDSRRMTLDAVRWLRKSGIEVRGHCIVWPSWRHVPSRVKAMRSDKKALRAAVARRVTEVVTANKGMLTEWDVVNEANSNHDLMDVLGKDVTAEWFRLAHKADGDCQLYINDYSLLDGRHVEGLERWVKLLKKAKAPLGGIGIQGHLRGGAVTPVRMVEMLDRLAKPGLPLQVTELDVLTGDPDLQAAYLRDVLTVMYSHPAVEGVIMWGFWDGAHWKRNALLYARDWSEKPALKVWRELIFKQWWTDAKGRSDAKGRFAASGFVGEYEVTASRGGKTKTVKATLPAAGATVGVVLE